MTEYVPNPKTYTWHAVPGKHGEIKVTHEQASRLATQGESVSPNPRYIPLAEDPSDEPEPKPSSNSPLNPKPNTTNSDTRRRSSKSQTGKFLSGEAQGRQESLSSIEKRSVEKYDKDNRVTRNQVYDEASDASAPLFKTGDYKAKTCGSRRHKVHLFPRRGPAE